MSSTLVELFKIACYHYDGESYGELVGYKSVDGDYTEDYDLIQFYSTRVRAGQDIDNSDAVETGYIEVIEPVFYDAEDTLTLNIKGE